jgi:uncharacterized protein (UPF0333 family)
VTIVVRNPLYRVIALVITLAIIAILYFAVIKPSNDTANTAIKQGEQQAQQAVKAAGNNVPVGVKNLTDCLVAAGTDTGKIQACQAKFKP